MPLRFVIDEDTRDERIWHAIEQHNLTRPAEGIDAVRVGDANGPSLRTLDPELIAWSVQAVRIIVSHDTNTLIGHHDEFVKQGGVTPGLIIVRRGTQIPVLVEWLALVAHVCEAHEFACQCRFIPE